MIYYVGIWENRKMNSENIVDTLIELKKSKNWTNYKIAVESNLPKSTIANVFNKKTMPQLDTLLAICKGFNITPYQLFGKTVKYEELTNNEANILKLWEALDTESQIVLKNLMCLLLNKKL